MPFSDRIIIGNNPYVLVETKDFVRDCRKCCALRHRCGSADFAPKVEAHSSTGEVVTMKAKPCEVLARVSNGRYAKGKNYIFKLALYVCKSRKYCAVRRDAGEGSGR